MNFLKSRFSFVALAVVICGLVAAGIGYIPRANAAPAASSHPRINCAGRAVTCPEGWDSEAVFGKDHYIGHDEPANLFYSNVPGSGNQMRYRLVLPTDPTPATPLERGKSFNFELHPAFWFGMAMRDTQSYPELLSTCTADSDKNIVDPAVSPRHPGTAFMVMQFYPPGWVPFQAPGGISCAPTQCSAAQNIPYEFHPMYSTSSEKTLLPWASHSYIIAFSDESGNFDSSTAVSAPGGNGKGLEGIKGDQEPADSDDFACQPARASLLVKVT